MRHTFTSHFGLNHLYAAFFANDAPVFHALVFAAIAFVVFGGAKNFGAKQPVTFGLKGAVVNGFRFFDLAVRPFANLFRRSQRDSDTEILSWISRFSKKIV